MAHLDVLRSDPFFGTLQPFYVPVVTGLSLDSLASSSANAAEMAPLRPIVGLERVGRGLHQLVFPPSAQKGDGDKAESAQLDAAEAAKRRKRIYNADLEDYYALLDLTEEMFEATEEDVRRNYRMISLLCHPDKADPDAREEAETRFKAIQKGGYRLFHSARSLLSRFPSPLSHPFSHALPPPPRPPARAPLALTT